MCELVAAFVDHLVAADHKSVFGDVVVQLGTRIGVGNRNLNGFHVKLFCESDRVLNGLLGFARESEDEIPVNDQAKLVSILGKLAGALKGCAFFNVLQNLRVTGFEADDQQPASCFLHRF